MSIWICFDHTSWKPDASPSMQATITNVSHKNVQYTKNNKKIKTTVEFSDGFVFTTCLQDRENHIMSYTISIGPETGKEIVRRAIATHEKAVAKKN